MKLHDWADINGLSDRQIAAMMTDWIKANHPEVGEGAVVAVSAAQKYRTERIPIDPIRVRAIVAITEGWVTPNDFYNLPLAV